MAFGFVGVNPFVPLKVPAWLWIQLFSRPPHVQRFKAPQQCKQEGEICRAVQKFWDKFLYKSYLNPTVVQNFE